MHSSEGCVPKMVRIPKSVHEELRRRVYYREAVNMNREVIMVVCGQAPIIPRDGGCAKDDLVPFLFRIPVSVDNALRARVYYRQAKNYQDELTLVLCGEAPIVHG